jgi:type III secretory pathway component EscT
MLEENINDNYALIFMNSALFAGNPWGPLSLFFLFLARILPVISLSPFLGARVLPHPVKLALAISLYLIFLPQLLAVTMTPLQFNLGLVFYLIKEMLLGYIMGFIISMPFNIVQSSGIIVDHQRGGASLMVNDPTVQNQSSPLGTLFNMVMIYIFFTLDGPFLFLDGISTSFDIIPPDKFLPDAFFDRSGLFWHNLIAVLNKVMVASIRLATPALLAILMTDVFLGIANRLAPQVQITFLGMPLKSLLALMVVCIGWNLLIKEFSKEGYTWLDVLSQTLTILKSNATGATAAATTGGI